MSNKYIVINEGTGGINKRFKAIQMRPKVRVAKSIKETVGGEYDASYGQIYESYFFMLRVPYQSLDANYGSYSDLLTALRRNDPNGTPGTTFTFTDHYGTEHTSARFSADAAEVEPLTTILDGSSNAASYLIPVTILLEPGDTITSEDISP